jgi:hypothetical protein
MAPIGNWAAGGWVCADCRRQLLNGRRKTGRGIGGGGGGRRIHSGVPYPEVEAEEDEGFKAREVLPRKKPPAGSSMSLGTRPLPDFIEEMLDLSPELPDLDARTPVTVARLLFESDIAQPSTNRLVDLPQHARNWTLWRTLLVFRKRMHQDQGVKDVWKGMKMRGAFDLPTSGHDADVFWGIFLATGLKDVKFLHELVDYAKELSERTNREEQWAPFYDEIILHHLVNVSEDTVPLHWTLFPEFASQSWARLFSKAWEKQQHPRAHHFARKIHATLANPRLYRPVIRDLCEKNEHWEAWRWHKHFLKHGDLPRDSSAANELVQHNAATGRRAQLELTLRSFKRGPIPVVESTLRVAVQARRQAPHEVADIIFASCPDFIGWEALGDRFWGALFEMLSPKDVFAYAFDFGKGCIVGENTINMAMTQLSRGREEVINILEHAGLTVKTEQLLLPPPEPPSQLDTGNQRLQQLLKEFQIVPALEHLAKLQKQAIPLTCGSVTLLFSSLLRRRAAGKRPTHGPHIFPYGKDIDAALTLMLSLQRSGTKVPWGLWKELMRRLGMTQRLDELERLVFRLIHVYRPTGIPEISRRNPYRKLFTSVVIRALVEWGWLYQQDIMWGVTLVRDMKARGVYVDTRSVFRAVRVRAARVEGGINYHQALELVDRVSEVFGEPVGNFEVLLKDAEMGRRLKGVEVELKEEIRRDQEEAEPRTWGYGEKPEGYGEEGFEYPQEEIEREDEDEDDDW